MIMAKRFVFWIDTVFGSPFFAVLLLGAFLMFLYSFW
jgi:hypothetical protein